MATAREVRAKVRQQMQAQIAARQDSALAVAAAWAKVEKARARAQEAEREAGNAVAASTLALPDLADLSGVPVSELRRLVRSARQTVETPTGVDVDTDVTGGEPTPAPATG